MIRILEENDNMSTIKEKADEILEKYNSDNLRYIGINLYDSENWYSKAYVSLPIVNSSIEEFTIGKET